jgi:RNA polymerase sigma-70 factor (ECF subfamily)
MRVSTLAGSVFGNAPQSFAVSLRPKDAHGKTQESGIKRRLWAHSTALVLSLRDGACDPFSIFSSFLLETIAWDKETTVMKPANDDYFCEPDRQRFMTTSWALVAQATSGDTLSHDALAELCRAYWYPLYMFHQRYRSGATPDRDGEDSVQSFFLWLIESNVIERADEDRGRFRTFLLSAFKQFLARQYQHNNAAKRKPDVPVVSFDQINTSRQNAFEPYHDMTPDKIFDYSWALELIEHAMNRLRSEWSNAGRLDRFEALRNQLSGNREIDGRALAEQLGITEGAVRVAVHRLRQRYAQLLRDEVRKTGISEADVDSELSYLFCVLQG